MNEVKELVKKLAGINQEMYSLICKVKSVTGTTCDVTPVNGDADILEVRIFPSDAKSGLLVIPKVGSIVLVSFIDKTQAFVSMVSEIESMSIKNSQHDLSDLMNDLVAAIDGILDNLKQIQVITPNGLSTGLSPGSLFDIERSKSDLRQFKQKLSTILKPF